MIGKPKAIFIFDPHRCAACKGTIGDQHATWTVVIDGIQRRFRFCPQCVDGQPTQARFRELFHRLIGVEDALERAEEEERIKQLLF